MPCPRGQGTIFSICGGPHASMCLCLTRSGHTPQVPLFLATDNTPLKAAVLGSGASLNASVLLPRSVTARVRAQGCAECMVNPVFKHDFNRSDVAEIFLDLVTRPSPCTRKSDAPPAQSVSRGTFLADDAHPLALLLPRRVQFCQHRPSARAARPLRQAPSEKRTRVWRS